MSIQKKVLTVNQSNRDVDVIERIFSVDGELGRFSFRSFDMQVMGSSSGLRIFPLQKGKEIYKTVGFKELAYFEGACESSFRKTSKRLNRTRYQQENGTPYRTLNSGVEQEARAIDAAIKEKTSKVLKSHNFTDKGCPWDELDYSEVEFDGMDYKVLKANLDSLKSEIDKEIADLIDTGNVEFENKEMSVNISIDDVSTKRQKSNREGKHTKTDDTQNTEQTQASKSTHKKKRKYVYNTVVHIENKEGHYTLTGLGVSTIIAMLVAFLLRGGLVADNWIFFLDGQRTLYTTVLKYLSWRGKLIIILDWYHLKKKCEMQLSLGLNNTQKRNEILSKILHYSWYGLTEKVYEIIDQIPTQYIKNQKELDKLRGYYERNYGYIPNYALRKKAGLRNSSNRGEKENDLIISDRQKDNGMAWSKKGSSSLGLLTAVKRNNEMNNWLNKKEIEFKLAA